jgi:penicillin amidase
VRISDTRRTVSIDGITFDICRTGDGVVQLWGADDTALAAGLGFAHAHDRMAQMMLVRLVGQGRLGECLQSDDETLKIDIFARGMGFRLDAEQDVHNLDAEVRRFADAYAAGVNHYLRHHGRPFDLWLVRHRPEPWTVADTIVTIKLMSYVGLAQTQQDFEKMLVQAIRGGVSVDKLRRLTAPHLDGLDDATIDLIRGLRWIDPMMPKAVRFLNVLPTVSASNNWAVTGTRTAGRGPVICFDPHMEVNRLPAIWYEAVMHTDEDYRIGITMPGVPGLVMGRTSTLAFGFTYGFMDMVDYFIEECRDGRCRRGDGWSDIEAREETIRRRGKEPIRITVRSTSHGVIEADPTRHDLADGLYLARAWSNDARAGSPSMTALCRILRAHGVPEAQQIVRHVTISCNWVLADRDGNIGYQQSGRLPSRRHSGLYPVPGWDDDHGWQGDVDADRLHTLLNPPEGFLATANDDLNPPHGPLVINLPMGSYRADRIRSVLADHDSVSIDDMRRLQLDLTSLHAERLMAVIRPLLPETPSADLLRSWDLRYDRGSRAATLFEEVYLALLRKVFGEGLFGIAAWDEMVSSTTVFADYYHLFDAVLLDGDPSWFGNQGREALYAEVLHEVLGRDDVDSVPTWGEHRQMMMRHILFGGKLPAWLGFDHGPIALEGNRSTVVQGQVFTAYGRSTTFGVSWRFITDMATDEVDTVLAGGPSGRRFSKWYRSEVDLWLEGRYKVLRPQQQRSVR